MTKVTTEKTEVNNELQYYNAVSRGGQQRAESYSVAPRNAAGEKHRYYAAKHHASTGG